MRLRQAITIAAAAAFFGLASPSPASAAPVVPAAGIATSQAADMIQTVHYRPYRHCHWSHGRRWCHGPHYLPRHGYHRHWRHKHRWHHRRHRH
jgi:hypothetical protein